MEIEPLSVPPGFRFHPTEEELVGYYLYRKVNGLKMDIDVIVDLDLYTIEPWDIKDRCGLGYEEENEWYFFSHKDKKYPTGKRTNRATAAGFWKATGRDKAVLSNNRMIGMRKTLVFYNGRAPNGRKSEWIMHEYRLQSTQHEPPQEEGWVVCRAFKKPSPNHKQHFETWNPYPYIDSNNTSLMPPPRPNQTDHALVNFQNRGILLPRSRFASQQSQIIEQIPQLDSPSTCYPTKGCDDSYDWKNIDVLLSMQLPETTGLFGQSDFFPGDSSNDEVDYEHHIFTGLQEL